MHGPLSFWLIRMTDAERQTLIDANLEEGVKRVRMGNQEVEGHSIPDQIAADKHLSAKTGVQGATRGVIFNKISPPGAA